MALTAAITAVVTLLVTEAAADTVAVGRTWQQLQPELVAIAARVAPLLGLVAAAVAALWLGLRIALIAKKEDIEVLQLDPRLPNPLTVLLFIAVAMGAAAVSLGQAGRGSGLAALVACCVVAVAARMGGPLVRDFRRTFLGPPFG